MMPESSKSIRSSNLTYGHDGLTARSQPTLIACAQRGLVRLINLEALKKTAGELCSLNPSSENRPTRRLLDPAMRCCSNQLQLTG